MGCCGKDNEVGVGGQESPIYPYLTRAPGAPVRANVVHDVKYLVIFCVFIGVMIAITADALYRGNPAIYINGYDSWGNICGKENKEGLPGVDGSNMDRRDHTYRFMTSYSSISAFLNPLNVLRTNTSDPRLCVRKCPQQEIGCMKFLEINGYLDYPVDEEILRERVCGIIPHSMFFRHKQILNMCIPDILFVEESNASIASVDRTDDFVSHTPVTELVLNSVYGARNQIAIMAVVTIIICMVVLVFLRLFVKAFVIVSIILFLLASLAILIFLWFNYAASAGAVTDSDVDKTVNIWAPEAVGTFGNVTKLNTTKASSRLSVVNVTKVLDKWKLEGLRESQFLLPVCILASVFIFMLIVLLVWARFHILMTVKLIQGSCDVIFSHPPIIIHPIITALWYMAVIAFICLNLGLIFTVVVYAVDRDGLVEYVPDPNYYVYQKACLFIFIGVWMLFFIKGCHKVIIADIISSWYYSDDTILVSLFYFLFPSFLPTVRLITFNLGSVAIASFTVSLMKFFRFIINKIDKKTERWQNAGVQQCFKCLHCCVGVMDRALRYVNHNVYICIAIFGDNFVEASKHSIQLITSHAAAMAVVQFLSGFLLFLAKFVTWVIVLFLSWYYLSYTLEEPSTFGVMIPTVVICVNAFLIIDSVFDVVSMGIDTLFICFCDGKDRERVITEDQERWNYLIEENVSAHHLRIKRSSEAETEKLRQKRIKERDRRSVDSP